MEQSAQQIAQDLLEVRQQMAQIRNVEKELSDTLRARIKAGDEQDYFKFVPSTTLQIADVAKALKWAKKFAPQLITVNATSARKVFMQDALTGSMGTPEKNGFALKTTETLREIKTSEVPGPE